MGRQSAKQVAKHLQSSDSDSGLDSSLLSKEELLSHFEYLWTKWGKGARKSDAKKWFMSKGKKKDGDFYVMLNDKVSDYFQWRHDTQLSSGFVPQLPALVVWLNGERWQDELTVTGKAQLSDEERFNQSGAGQWLAEERANGRAG